MDRLVWFCSFSYFYGKYLKILILAKLHYWLTQQEMLLRLTGATAILSTLLTVVGQPKTPMSAGKGGFRRGLPCLPSRDSINACKSATIKNVFSKNLTSFEVLVEFQCNQDNLE